MTLLAVLVALAMAVVVHDAIRRPTFRRLAVRNVLRRRNEAMLVVAGSLLGTAIITASFVVGDTVEGSERDIARTKLGEVDVVVTDPARPERLLEIAAAVPDDLPGVDGRLTALRIGATAATVGEGRVAEPYAGLVELDFDAARDFGSDPGATGLADAGATPAGDEVVVGADLASSLDVEAGDPIEVFAYGRSRAFVVREVVPRVGLAGFGSNAQRSLAPVAFVPPGTIEGMRAEAGDAAAAASKPDAMLLLSQEGGIHAGEHDRSLEEQVRRSVAGLAGVDVQPVKRDVLANARAQGESIGQLFTGMGGFSVIAGILLLVNIFVMLAEERKTELGVLRALGLKQRHLVRTFGMEGAIYSVLAAVLGGLLGILVGRLISMLANGVMNGASDALGVMEIRFTVDPATVATGMLIGLLISMVTVWATSFRIGRLNVIRAIRDLPEPPRDPRSIRPLVLGALGVVLGGLLFQAGISGRSATPTLAGLPIALYASIPLLGRLVPRRVAVTAPCLAALVWGVTAFSLVPESFRSADIPIFVIEGIILVGSAVAILTVNTDLLGGLTERIGALGGGLAARLGLAYPLARRFRTGLLLGMFALIIFTLTFLATLSSIFESEGPRLAEIQRGSYDLVVDSARSNPVSAADLASEPGVAAVAPLRVAFVDYETRLTTEPAGWAVAGFDASLLDGGPPALSERAFASDLETWQAVLAGQPLPGGGRPVIIPEFFLTMPGPPQETLRVGDRFEMVDTASGRREVLVAVGSTEADFTFNGPFVPEPFLREFAPDTSVARHYVRLAEGADADDVAGRLNGRFLTQGADARSFDEAVGVFIAQQAGFFNLIQGYLALGLVIGIAGLGVVLVRAVRERRRQIGMLRAMGFTSSTVRRSFVLEAAFIAVQGIAIGVGLGLLTSWSVLSNSAAFGNQELPFEIPWASLLVVCVAAPLVASLLAAAGPAHAASRIRPAVALRVTD